jgi:hypothetical protein
MATLRYSSFSAGAIGGLPVVRLPALGGDSFTFTGTSAPSAALQGDGNLVQVISDEDCCITAGPGTPVATDNDVFLPANTPIFFQITPGHKLAAITV